MNFKDKIKDLKPYDLNCNVFDVYSYNGLSMQELLCQFFTKINECIGVSNKTLDLAEWLVSEGLSEEVTKKLLLWYQDGTLEELINITLFENLNEKVNDVKSQLNQTVNDVDIIKSSQYILNATNENFDVKFNEALNICKETGQQIFIPSGSYNCNSTFIIDFDVNIQMDKHAVLNINKTLLDVFYPYCTFELKGKIYANFNGDVIRFNDPIVSDKCIINTNLTLNLFSDNYLPSLVGVKVNTAFWKNVININTHNVGIPISINGRWANSNEFKGKLINFYKAVNLESSFNTMHNKFYIDFEQTLNHTSYGVYQTKNLGSSISNNFYINHWLDNYSGKYWCYYDENYEVNNKAKFINNKIEGELEGTLKINEDLNIMQTLYFTRRDRSKINNDTIGLHNKPWFSNFNKRNLLKLDFNNFDETTNFILGKSNNENVACSIKKVGTEKVLCIEQLNDTGGFITHNAIIGDHHRGKTFTLIADVMIFGNNKNYSIFLNDGITSTQSNDMVNYTGEWANISVTHTVSESSTILQLNLGRKKSSITNAKGDKIYIRNIMLIEGETNFCNYSQGYEQNFIQCYSLPTPSHAHLGRVMIVDNNGNNKLYICLNTSSGYAWKELSVLS